MRSYILDGLGFTHGNPLRPFMIGYTWFNIATVIASLVLLVIDVDPMYVWLTLMWPLGAPLVFVVIWLVNKPYARDLNELRSGNHIVRWEPSLQEWERFAAAEWSRARRDARLAPIFGCVLALIFGSFTLAVANDPVLAGLMAGAGLMTGLAVAAISYLSGRTAFNRGVTNTGDIRFSERGVLKPDGYHPYRGFSVVPIEIIVEDSDPAVMRFRVGSLSDQMTIREQEFRVPIPDGREAEADALAARLMEMPNPASPSSVMAAATTPAVLRHRES